jgi:hypothetical protein
LVTGLSLHFAAYAGEDILHHVILWLNSDAGCVTEVVSSIFFNCGCLCSLPLPLYVEKKKKRNMVNFYVKQIINILAIGKATGRKFRG